jgi:hypothetical protein
VITTRQDNELGALEVFRQIAARTEADVGVLLSVQNEDGN